MAKKLVKDPQSDAVSYLMRKPVFIGCPELIRGKKWLISASSVRAGAVAVQPP
jgi:hypothetical protein